MRFAEGAALLKDRTRCGDGLLRGSVTIDQVYAHFQHERLDLHHPRGGHAQFLTRPLFDNYLRYMQMVADDYLGHGGRHGMARAMEDLSDEAERQAPWEFGDLMHSGHPEVERGGVTVYDRPPKRHRLTEAELRQKSRWRFDTYPDRLKGWIYWHYTARGRAGLSPRGAA
ncbi:MAG TPA: hypothetical protein VEV45_20980 [Streptosporangiaceae bacterium]|nr:hypothetical protein [Streptosporangiaceae bacterium]